MRHSVISVCQLLRSKLLQVLKVILSLVQHDDQLNCVAVSAINHRSFWLIRVRLALMKLICLQTRMQFYEISTNHSLFAFTFCLHPFYSFFTICFINNICSFEQSRCLGDEFYIFHVTSFGLNLNTITMFINTNILIMDKCRP